MKRSLLVLLTFLMGTLPAHAETLMPDDPLVALDAAKITLGEGRLEEARRQFAQVPDSGGEQYIAEEVALQQLLLDGAFLSAVHFLLGELKRQEMDGSKYNAWLRQRQDEYASSFATHVRRYLELTANGNSLSFVRFRLPLVNDDHLRDVELYSDAQVLSAAVTNWEEGREGLGKGLILAQARVAVTLGAAVYYDMPDAKTKLTDVSARLAAGVPLDHAQVLDWIAENASRMQSAGNGLGQLARGADEKLLALTTATPEDPLRKRAQNRLNPPKPAPETKPQGKPSKGKQKSKR